MLMQRYRDYFLGLLAAMFIGAIPAYADTLSDDEVNQKLKYAESLIHGSATAKRIEASDVAEAQAKYQEAEMELEAAQREYGAGRLKEAQADCDKAMNLLFLAARLVPSEHAKQMAQARYDKLLKSIETLETSYVAALGESASPTLDLSSVRQKMTRAARLSNDGQTDEANRILSSVMNELSSALNALHGNKTISYEMIFDTPAEEYAYEVKRYLSLEEAIPLAIEQRNPSQANIDKAQTFIDLAQSERREADATADRGNHEKALLLIRDATMQIETALTVLGVTY